MDDDGGRLHRLELLSTILLAVAAVMTAWATYQSNQWRGETAIKYSKATAARIQSSAASTRAGQLTQVDIATFLARGAQGPEHQALLDTIAGLLEEGAPENSTHTQVA